MTDTTVPGLTRPDLITNSRLVGQRGKIEAALLVILSAGYSASTDVATTLRAPKPQTFVEQAPFVQAWKPPSILTTITLFPADIVLTWDNFNGWPPTPPSFDQPARNNLLAVLDTKSFIPYAPAPDIIYPQFRRKPIFVDVPPFIQQNTVKSLINYTILTPPAGDLTTQLRKQQWFDPVKYVDSKNPGAWHVTLYPGVAPPPPPPTQPPGPYWPQPSTITNLPCRGAWVLPGGMQAIWVIGSGAFLMTVNTPANASTPTTFNLARIGTLNTNSGPVNIRDNGAGGTACIVDGAYGYYYYFTGVNGTQGQFEQITDPNFLGATHIAFIDGWWVFNQPNSQVFYTPTSTYSNSFNGTNFALKDGATDNLVALIENKEELWLIGERTTEVWYDAGGTYFAFQRLISTMLQIGCAAKYSVARFNSGGEDGLVWLARSERGENVVVKTEGYAAKIISQPAINNAISKYTVVSDAIGFTYQSDGHEFYVLTFPTAINEYGGTGITWVYDSTTDMWHQRASYEPYSDKFNRHRANCFINFQDRRLVGDYQNGSIYHWSRSTYTDAGWPLVGWRRAPHIWDGGARNRVFMAFLQVDFRPGVGNASGLSTNPQAVLQISRDGGSTFGQKILASMGKIGNYLNRAIWRRLSFSRDAVVDVKVYDAVNRDIVGATLRKMEPDA